MTFSAQNLKSACRLAEWGKRARCPNEESLSTFHLSPSLLFLSLASYYVTLDWAQVVVLLLLLCHALLRPRSNSTHLRRMKVPLPITRLT